MQLNQQPKAHHIADDLLQDMVRRLIETLKPQKIYLFGSHTYGAADPRSDLDLLVVVDDDETGEPDALALAGRGQLLKFRVPVDLLVYPRPEMDKWAPVRCSLPNTVMCKGKLLHAA